MSKDKATKEYKLLFVCLGNICRSPAANAVMQKMVDDAHLSDRFFIDSAGVGGWHIGDLPDRRMREHGLRRGYRVDHIARQFYADKDFTEFDYIIVMDDDNYNDISTQANNQEERNKIHRLTDFAHNYPNDNVVPDPYYGGAAGFEYALDLIEDGCKGLLATLGFQS